MPEIKEADSAIFPKGTESARRSIKGKEVTKKKKKKKKDKIKGKVAGRM